MIYPQPKKEKMINVPYTTFTEDHLLEFDDTTPITLLYGPNGIGKTQFLLGLRKYLQQNDKKVFIFRGDKDHISGRNVNANSYGQQERDHLSSLGEALSTNFASHGEEMKQIFFQGFVRKISEYHQEHPQTEIYILLDEPDKGWDLQTQPQLANVLHNLTQHGKVVCASHSYFLLISQLPYKLIDMESKSYTDAKSYLKKIFGNT